MQQTWSQSLTWGNQSWPVPLQQYKAKSHTGRTTVELRPGGLRATQAPKAEIKMLVSLQSLHVYKEKLQSNYFSILVFYSMFWKVKCICTLLCCLYQCLNSSTARWITSRTTAPEGQCQKQIHCTWIVSCQVGIVSVWSTEGPAEN